MDQRRPLPLREEQFGDEIVPDLKLNRRLVSEASRSGAISVPRSRASYSTPSSRVGSLSRSSRQASNPCSPSSPATVFLKRVNSQLSTPTSDPENMDVGAYHLGRILGRGGFSVVRAATCHGTVYAVKIIDKRQLLAGDLAREREIWQSLQHPHILPLLDVQETTNSLYLFTNLMPSGSLHQVVRDTRDGHIHPSLYDLKHYCHDLVEAIKYLHLEAGVVHRDIKLENCLLDAAGAVVLCDFGLSRRFSEIDSTPSSITSPNMQASPVVSRSGSLARFEGDIGGALHHALAHDSSIDGGRTIDSSLGIAFQPGLGLESPRNSRTGSFTDGPGLSRTGSAIYARSKPPSQATSAAASFRIGAASRRESNCDASSLGGSLLYASPEMLLDRLGLPACDIWALGVCIYTLFTLSYPFQHSFQPTLRQLIIAAEYDDSALLEDTGSVVALCLVRDLEERATIETIAERVRMW